jgi:hypothetical protein
MMMETARASETSFYSETTRSYIPEDSKLHTRRRENLKSHMPPNDASVWLAGLHVREVPGSYIGPETGYPK